MSILDHTVSFAILLMSALKRPGLKSIKHWLMVDYTRRGKKGQERARRARKGKKRQEEARRGKKMQEEARKGKNRQEEARKGKILF